MKILVLVTLAIASTFQLKFGKCSDPVVFSPFNPSSFVGSGKVVQRTKSVPWDTKDCPAAKYSSRPDGKTDAVNCQYSIANDKLEITNGILTFTNGGQGKMTGSKWLSGDYRILKLSSYLTVYSCTSYFFGLLKNEYAWIMRPGTPTTTEKAGYLAELLSLVSTLSSSDIVEPNQSAQCKYAFTVA